MLSLTKPLLEEIIALIINHDEGREILLQSVAQRISEMNNINGYEIMDYMKKIGAPAGVSFNHDNAGAIVIVLLVELEPCPHIHYRNHLSAKIDHTFDEVRYIGDRRDAL